MPIQKLSRIGWRHRTAPLASAVSWPFPAHPGIRFAHLGDASSVAFGVGKAFWARSADDLEGFLPNVVVGSVASLENLAEQKRLGILKLLSLDQAVVALTRRGQVSLNDVSRQIFWQAFGVPLYEVMVGSDNSVTGYECELHEGWHLQPHVRLTERRGRMMLEADDPAPLQTAVNGVLTDEECGCGRAGRRLLNIQPGETHCDQDLKMKRAIA